MTRFLKTAFLAGTLGLLGTCAHEPPLGTPGVGCNLASCCYGWIWMLGCMPAHPPDCGCTCKEFPRPYGSKEECEAAHPPPPPGAGVVQFK